MRDEDKTKEQLIIELHELIQRLAASEENKEEGERAEKALRESEERYKALFERSLDCVFLTDFEGRFLDANQAALDLLDYQREDIHRLTFASLLEADQLHLAFQTAEEIRSTGCQKNPTEFRLRRKDGEDVFVETQASLIYHDGKPFAIQGIARDITERKQAEEALRGSEEKYRNLFENANEAIFVTQDGKLVFLNPMTSMSTGYSDEELASRPFVEFVHPDDRDMVMDRHASRLRGEEIPPLYSFRIVHKDGSVRWAELNAVLINWGGKKATLNFLSDITERKKAEEALHQSEREKAILNQIANVFLMSPDEKIYEEVLVVILKVLKCRYGIFGYIGDNGDLIIPSMTREIWSDCQVEGKSIVFPRHQWGNSLWGKAIEEKKSFSSEGPFQTPEGHLPVCNFLTVPVVFADRTIGLVSLANKDRGFTVEDKTLLERIAGNISPILNTRLQRDKQELERKRAEVALQATSTELQLIFENMINAFIVWESVFDENGKYVSFRFGRFNEAFARIAKLKYEEVRGKDVFEVWPATEQNWVEVYGAVAVSGIPRSFDMYHEPTKGWYHCNAYRPSDSPSQVYVIFEDITDRKRQEEKRRTLEERLHRAEKMEALGTMAGGVAHDLNNVLGIVVGYSELILYEMEEAPSSLKSHVKEILKGGERAAAIVQDLLTLTRRGVTSRQVLNLNNIVKEYQESPEFAKIMSCHPNTANQGDLEADLLNISGSSLHLGKTLMNLVANAVEAMPNGGLITIKTRNQYLDKPISGYDEVKEGDYVVLTVSDTGEGIPSTDMKRIFEPFYTKKIMGRSGTGLGLAVVWGTVKDHLGYINVESEENKGTTFSLYFPVTREEVTPEQVSMSASEYMGNGESILVVDDVKEQRELATMMLTKLNYSVTSVPSGEEAVKYMQEYSSELIVLDMIMEPGMDGLDTYLKILDIHPQQKAIIVSGFSETERVSKAQSLGAGTYVKKPYVLEKLGLAVRRELDRVRCSSSHKRMN